MFTPLFQQATPLGRRTRRLSSSFSPASLSGLSLWLDGADAATFATTGSLVDQWSDKSVNLNHATQSGAARPAYNTHQINSKPTVTFDSNSTYLNLSLPISANGATIFALANFNGLTSTGPFLGYQFGFGDAYFGVYGSANTYYIFSDSGDNASASLARSATAKDYYATTGVNDFSLYADGTTFATGGPGTFSNPFGQVGARTVGSEHMDGNLAELILYGRVLNGTELGQVTSYLRAKWGTA